MEARRKAHENGMGRATGRNENEDGPGKGGEAPTAVQAGLAHYGARGTPRAGDQLQPRGERAGESQPVPAHRKSNMEAVHADHMARRRLGGHGRGLVPTDRGSRGANGNRAGVRGMASKSGTICPGGGHIKPTKRTRNGPTEKGSTGVHGGPATRDAGHPQQGRDGAEGRISRRPIINVNM